ncbi:hypothetical protein SADUNF_Sadunf06G0028500 [Salix dunnii]|uniref:Uncharacterized protein n=1 Tax=Salix dunnii TaxID=1413687 RepID=A0A835K0I2_9ROSI|nr:hypothetical protein SADUNF_Sadunf06G0028500 [Salix dunnii]
MDLLDYLDTTWYGAAVYVNDKTKKDLDRPYGRVNRKQLKSKMLQKCISNGVKFHQAKVIKVTKWLVEFWKRIFLEETSLVARPGVPMKDIQERMVARLRHLGMKVKRIKEDERCVIPMGGPLPILPQRVVGIGGITGMVHPSTGFSESELSTKFWKDLWPIERRRQRVLLFWLEIMAKGTLPLVNMANNLLQDRD